MRDPNQKMRYTDSELSLIKGLFAGNDDLLYAVRKTMLQLPLNEEEAKTLKQSINDSTMALLVKTFTPYLDGDAPIHQLASQILNLSLDIKTKNPDEAWPWIKAKEIEMEYLSQQLKVLSGDSTEPKIKLSELEDISGPKTKREETYTHVLAWSFLLSYVDSQIQQLKFLAGLKEESVEETKNRLAKNSNK